VSETVTLYTVVVPYGQDVPALLSDSYDVKPKSFMRTPSKYDGLPNRVNKQDFERGGCAMRLTALEAWDFYINEEIEKKTHHQKQVDFAQRRLDWAFAQHQRAKR
jgi:hypothetical protein